MCGGMLQLLGDLLYNSMVEFHRLSCRICNICLCSTEWEGLLL